MLAHITNARRNGNLGFRELTGRFYTSKRYSDIIWFVVDRLTLGTAQLGFRASCDRQLAVRSLSPTAADADGTDAVWVLSRSSASTCLSSERQLGGGKRIAAASDAVESLTEWPPLPRFTAYSNTPNRCTPAALAAAAWSLNPVSSAAATSTYPTAWSANSDKSSSQSLLRAFESRIMHQTPQLSASTTSCAILW